MAFSRDLYKTKLCTLYQRGHCPRQSCSFAHGDAELRRNPGSFSGRRDYRGDLRERLERRPSPRRRFSPGRDGRGRPGQLDRRLSPGDKEHSHSRSSPRGRPTRSPSPPSERRDKKRVRLDGPDAYLSEVSGEPWVPNTEGDESPVDLLEEELGHVRADIELLTEQKALLEELLERKEQEISKLSAENLEIDFKLAREQENHKRLGSKMKKFVKVHLRCMRAQEEVKKTQLRLQKLVDDLPLGEGTKLGHGEDSDVNIMSDGGPEQPSYNPGENDCNQLIEPSILMKDASDTEGNILEKNGSIKRRTSAAREKSRASKVFRSNLLESGTVLRESNDEGDMAKVQTAKLGDIEVFDRTEMCGVSLAEDTSTKPRNSIGEDLVVLGSLVHDKAKIWDLGFNIPSTGLAAHAEDEQLEIVDDESRGQAGLSSQEITNLAALQSLASEDLTGNEMFLPSHASQVITASSIQYAQYKGEDEEVDVEVIDDAIDGQI